MFRHWNRGRTYLHNAQLAGLLSIVAGCVNIVGVLWLNKLTTNITGHFAFFSEDLFLANYKLAITSILYLISFLLGAFTANTSMELISKFKQQSSYMVPISIEVILLIMVAYSDYFVKETSTLIPCTLLFAMGLQNALVTKVSRSVVRTTHLTGIFTDLGIELSQLIFRNKPNRIFQLKRAILLKTIIVVGFFLGGLVCALLFKWLGQRTLLIPVGILLFAQYRDRLLLGYYRYRRRH